jgi:low temperature requirement protein LtrA
MVEQRQAQRRGRVLGGVRFTGEDHRATPFELFFDLVYVFAVTQVTGYMAAEHSAHGVLQGLLLLTLLWWTWSGYTWLGNQARADEGVLRAGMVVAMAAMFVVALTIPEAWLDAPGGLNGPLVLVGAYLLVRCVHLTVDAVAATGDPGLRHQVAITWLPTLAGGALLVAGALLGGWTQTLLFAGALLSSRPLGMRRPGAASAAPRPTGLQEPGACEGAVSADTSVDATPPRLHATVCAVDPVWAMRTRWTATGCSTA